MHSARSYRVDDSSVPRLLALLHSEGAALDLAAEARFGFREAAAVPGVQLRLRASRDFAELHIEGATDDSPPVFAAGPVEDFLAALGFAPVSGAVSTELSLESRGAHVRLRHVAATGWRCEIESESEAALGTAADLLGLVEEMPTTSALSRVEIASAPNGVERRSGSDRRIARADRRTRGDVRSSRPSIDS